MGQTDKVGKLTCEAANGLKYANTDVLCALVPLKGRPKRTPKSQVTKAKTQITYSSVRPLYSASLAERQWYTTAVRVLLPCSICVCVAYGITAAATVLTAREAKRGEGETYPPLLPWADSTSWTIRGSAGTQSIFFSRFTTEQARERPLDNRPVHLIINNNNSNNNNSNNNKISRPPRSARPHLALPVTKHAKQTIRTCDVNQPSLLTMRSKWFCWRLIPRIVVRVVSSRWTLDINPSPPLPPPSPPPPLRPPPLAPSVSCEDPSASVKSSITFCTGPPRVAPTPAPAHSFDLPTFFFRPKPSAGSLVPAAGSHSPSPRSDATPAGGLFAASCSQLDDFFVFIFSLRKPPSPSSPLSPSAPPLRARDSLRLSRAGAVHVSNRKSDSCCCSRGKALPGGLAGPTNLTPIGEGLAGPMNFASSSFSF